MEKIFDLRFVVPPTLFLGLVLIVSPQWSFDLLKGLNFASFTSLLGIAVLTLGFIISSIVQVFVNLNKLTVGYTEKEEKILKELFKDRAINEKYLQGESDKVCPYLGFNKDNNINVWNSDLASWFMAGKAGEYIKNQIDKRWQMAITNFNCFTASVLAYFVIIYLAKFYPPFLPKANLFMYLGLFPVFLMPLFYYLGKNCLKSVRTMDKILVWDYERNKKNDQNESNQNKGKRDPH